MTVTNKPVQLHVVHDLGGGIERWYRDYCQADQSRTNFVLKPYSESGKYGAGLMLFAADDETIPLRFWVFDSPIDVLAETHDEYQRVFNEILRDFAVDGLLVSSFIGHSLDVLTSGLPTVVVTHDYFPLCPAIYAYFDAPCTQCDSERLAECHAHNLLAFNPFRSLGVTERARIRHRYLELLQLPGLTLVHPTAITRRTWHSIANQTQEPRIQVIAHGSNCRLYPVPFLPVVPGSRLKIVIPGVLIEHKGLNLLLDVIGYITEFCDVFFVGSGVTGRFFDRHPNVTVVEHYSPEDLPSLMEKFSPDVGLLASICPETFSYVLTELTALGIPVLATQVGSFAERIIDGETGYLFDPTTADLLAGLKRIHSDRVGLTAVKSRICALVPRNASQMVEDYHHLMPLEHTVNQAPTTTDNNDRWERWARTQAVVTPPLRRELDRLRHGTAILQHCLNDGARQLSAQGREIAEYRDTLDQRANELAHQSAIIAQRDEANAEFARQLEMKTHLATAADRTIAEQGNTIAERDRTNAELSRQLDLKTQQAANTHYQLQTVLESTSWTITRPLRVLVRIFRGERKALWTGLRYHAITWGKAIYWHLPVRWRQSVVESAYRLTGSLFTGTSGYGRWRQRRDVLGKKVAALSAVGTVDIDAVTPYVGAQPGSIAIHAHIFYSDLASEFAEYFSHMPYCYDLYVSVPDEAARIHCSEVFSRLPLLEHLYCTIVPNQGRDIAPMLCTFGEYLREYDFFAHAHGKKSLYNQGRTSGWREYLLDGLFGNREQISRIFSLLTGADNIGIVYPQTFVAVPYQAHTWLANRAMGAAWCDRLGINSVPSGYFDFPAGSMFWARGGALRSLFDAGIRLEDFPSESGQNDGTLAHCIERLLGLLPRARGYSSAILVDKSAPSWSRWRCDTYFDRSFVDVSAQLSNPAINVVAFDIFDTLLLRPLINPEQIKRIVARRAGGQLGEKYLAERYTVESLARERSGHDVGLDEIYREWLLTKSLTLDQLNELCALEILVEKNSVKARPDAVALLNRVAAAGKRVVLVSDMFLPVDVVTAMLVDNGITGWHQLYLSNVIGCRKDSGKLYTHLLSEEGVRPEAIAMVGDNERSDVQIPGDMGFRIHHIFRATELARCLPKWNPLIERFENYDDPNFDLGLGLILRHNFAPLFYPRSRPDEFAVTAKDIGYTVVGPVALAFSAWVGSQAVTDGIDRLFFLSREGALLKRVYDQWHRLTGLGPPAEYLVLSRRSVNVPVISSIEDIFDFARMHFFANTPDMFLRERYGITLSANAWTKIEALGFWQRKIPVEVRGENIDHLKPLLEELYPQILAQAADEKPALMAYLRNIGLTGPGHHAVVDVGYSGTIQGRLNRLLKRPIDGYYMLTNKNAKHMGQEHGVSARGCFADGVVPDDEGVPFNFHSFRLEKLLSSDEEQVIRYRIEPLDDGEYIVKPQFRENCEAIQETQTIRSEIQAGVIAFVDDALAVRQHLLPDFTFPVELAASMFETLVTDPSKTESAILEKIVLDDFYCGRGLVL